MTPQKLFECSLWDLGKRNLVNREQNAMECRREISQELGNKMSTHAIHDRVANVAPVHLFTIFPHCHGCTHF